LDFVTITDSDEKKEDG